MIPGCAAMCPAIVAFCVALKPLVAAESPRESTAL